MSPSFPDGFPNHISDGREFLDVTLKLCKALAAAFCQCGMAYCAPQLGRKVMHPRKMQPMDLGGLCVRDLVAVSPDQKEGLLKLPQDFTLRRAWCFTLRRAWCFTLAAAWFFTLADIWRSSANILCAKGYTAICEH